MSRSDDERLADIVEAAQTVRLLVTRGRIQYDKDPAVRLAIERLLEMIGEAANALTDERRGEYANVPWADIRRFRIVLAHHYQRVDPDQVWTIAKTDVPALLVELEGDVEPLIMAVDWSGSAKGGGAPGIRTAVTRDGIVRQIVGGLARPATIANVDALRLAHNGPAVVGFDFSFGFAASFAGGHGRSMAEVWETVSKLGATWLAMVPDPFYGKGGKKKPAGPVSNFYRQTELDLVAAGIPPASTFCLAGPKQVGTGSIRGMPFLIDLEAMGWSVWPAGDTGDATVVEIYPAALRKVAPPDWEERVLVPMATQDDRDAAVSAIVMWDHRHELLALRAETEPPYSIEGRIWMP